MISEVSHFDLSGKTAVVTGASRGIGAGIAAALIRAGADVISIQRSRPGEQLVSLADRFGKKLHHVTADFQSEVSIALALKISQELANVDILINNAGTQIRHDSVDFPLQDFDAVLAINTRAVFQLSTELAKGMIERGCGKIVNLSSLLAFQGGFRVPAYAASKGAVDQLTKAFSNEWASLGINVNAIAPGYFETEMNTALLGDEARLAQLSARIPAKRWGRPEDIGGAAVFLCSAAADYIHGITLPVDGGWLGR